MKNFLIYTLATVTGLIVASFLFFFVLVAGMGAIMATGEKSVVAKSNSLLVIDTESLIPERTNDDPFASIDFINMTISPAIGLNDILKNLEKAATDPNIVGLLIQNGTSPNGWATTQELRNALIKFREESGKFIVAYSDKMVDQKSYYLSSIADKVYINPTINVMFSGISGQVFFYKNALDRLGVDVQVLRHGKFKGAVEPFLLDGLSDENRAQIKDYTGSIWNSVIGEISLSRNIPVEQLNNYADNLSAYMAEGALESGLVDGLLYNDELTDSLVWMMRVEDADKVNRISIADYSNVASTKTVSSKDKISVIYASGDIVSAVNDNNIEGTRFAELISKERKDSSVKAIVLRVNSPGGEATAADLIWREVELAAQTKPVIVSMGDYAASGGYYISAPATKIFADPVTITGSIGVFGLLPNAEKLLEEKLGITTETVNTNSSADFPSLFKPLTGNEEMVMQQGIEKVYSDFVTKVSSGRNIPFDAVDSIGQGRVWSGASALSIGLVDQLGGIEDAINEAVVLANLSEYSIKELPEIEDSYTKIMKQLGGQIRSTILKNELGKGYEIYNEAVKLKELTGIQVRLPYFIVIK